MISDADTIVWLVSRDSLASEYCRWELTLAVDKGRKLVPVMLDNSDRAGLPEQLGSRHVLPAEGVFKCPDDIPQLQRAIETDLRWNIWHTRTWARARAWHEGGRKGDRLLRGSELRQAEAGLKRAQDRDFKPHSSVLEFVSQSQAGRARLRRRVALGSFFAAIILLAGGAGLLLQNQLLVTEEQLKWQAQAFAAATEIDKELDAERDPLPALQKALAALPANRESANSPLSDILRAPRPYVPELEAAVLRVLDRHELITQVQAGGEITKIAYSPSGKRVAAGTANGRVVIFEKKSKPASQIASKSAQGIELLFAQTAITALAFAPHNTDLWVGTSNGYLIKLNEKAAIVSKTKAHAHAISMITAFRTDDNSTGAGVLTASADGTAAIFSAGGQISRRFSHLSKTFEPTATRITDGKDGRDVTMPFTSPFTRIDRPLDARLYGLGVTHAKLSPDYRTIYTSGEDLNRTGNTGGWLVWVRRRSSAPPGWRSSWLPLRRAGCFRLARAGGGC